MPKTLFTLYALLLAGVATVRSDVKSLDEVRILGAESSAYRTHKAIDLGSDAPEPNLDEFQAEIEPILEENCYRCHGEEKQKADFRVDALDPNLLRGPDVDWWLEVIDVLSNGEMPPEDEEPMPGPDRGKVIEWLSNELQIASQVRRSEQGHSSFRRMTRYEYNYALQDLLGLPFDFAKNLPPETYSEDGFENSSEMLQMSVMQFETYRELGRNALERAAIEGEPPETRYYSIPSTAAEAKMIALKEADIAKARRTESDPERLEKALARVEQRHRFNRSNAHFIDLQTGEGIKSSFNYRAGLLSHYPSDRRTTPPPVSSRVLVIPAGKEQKIDLSDQLPESGTLRIRIRASRASTQPERYPQLRLEFGNQPSNNSRTAVRVGHPAASIRGSATAPEWYQWDLHLSELPRNLFRGVMEIGKQPNPTEYITLQNVTQTLPRGERADIQIDYIEIIAPYYPQWPPESHTRIFLDSEHRSDEIQYAREILADFMPRAWRRAISDTEIDRKLKLFKKLRPVGHDFQETVIEVLATVLASPNFLYLTHDAPDSKGVDRLNEYELATRLSMFLWCSVPDDALLDLAAQGKLSDSKMLVAQTQRMLADPRSQRFAKHFTRQWLGMQLLDFLDVERESYPEFDDDLKEAMQQEPIAVFQDALQNNRSVVDFLHADYTLANERLARHYDLPGVYGNHFRRVDLSSTNRRGGLMTQAGLLAMNSDGKDSHPLKRGIWILERLLNDPPPSPPAAVPEIDLTDPEIAKLTLKQRIEDHRNDPACISCHAKIDPWGIAFENYDAVGAWRDEIDGQPVDATSRLFNNQTLEGMNGLKGFLLANRQDQFCRSMVHKITTYALGRPLTFSDRAGVDEITVSLRNKGDRLGDLISLIITSDLFLTK